MEKQESPSSNPRKSILKMAIANTLAEHGFVKADKQCFESLAEVCIQTFLYFVID